MAVRTDAVTGRAVTGQTITGTWWAQPTEAGLKLNAYIPAVTIVSGPTVTVSVSEAGLKLVAYLPAATVRQDASVSVPEAGLRLHPYPVALKVSSILAIAEAGLLLRAGSATILFVGQVWLHESDCEEIALVESPVTTLTLEESACSTLVLEPLTSR
jgi:hypothetical protein